jgi:hypothetical protein
MNLLFTYCLSILCFQSYHPYHFSYAEVEMNMETNRFEATLELTIHDIQENAITKNFNINQLVIGTKELDDFQLYLNRHFNFKSGNNSFVSFFEIEQIEHNKDGTLVLYMSSDGPKNQLKKLYFTFDLFFETYTNQENKLTFIYNSNKKSYSFNPIMTGHWIQIN